MDYNTQNIILFVRFESNAPGDTAALTAQTGFKGLIQRLAEISRRRRLLAAVKVTTLLTISQARITIHRDPKLFFCTRL